MDNEIEKELYLKLTGMDVEISHLRIRSAKPGCESVELLIDNKWILIDKILTGLELTLKAGESIEVKLKVIDLN